MSSPSPRTHLYRLGAVLVAGLVGFIVVKTLATPASWDYENWYRADVLIEIAEEPLVYGGNESCQTCHNDEHEEMSQFKHKTLSCESCHGALADHVREGKKVASAVVDDETTWQCLNCHQKLISRSADFPQFNAVSIVEHKEVEGGMLCISCHAAHDPTP